MLIPCVECGREVSDRAAVCPQCGYPLAPVTVARVAPVQATSSPAPVRAESSVMSGVKIGVGMFIVLPMIIGAVMVALAIAFGAFTTSIGKSTQQKLDAADRIIEQTDSRR